MIKQGYEKSETDLFVARAQLDLMSRTENFDLPRRLRKEYFASLKSPLLNFVDMLPEVLEMKDFGLFQDLIKKYDTVLKRDPVFNTTLDRISQKYFDGQRIIQESGLAKLLSSFLGSK